MTSFSRYTAFFLACLTCAAFAGCENNKNSSVSDSAVTTSETAENTTDVTTAEAVEETTAEITTTEPVTTAKAEASAKSAEGYPSAYEAAKAYYDAYLEEDADAVYDIFCSEEIYAYDTFLEENDYFDGKNARSVLKKSVIIGAISDSMLNIHDIMEEYSPNDTWKVSLVEDDLEEISDEELEEFNESLGTSFTGAMDCGYVFYTSSDEESSFVGNGCAFIKYKGRWYLSYTTVLNAELITYLDIFE